MAKGKAADKGKNTDTKGKGKGKAKDDGESGGGKGGKGLKAANSINVRHILVCHSISVSFWGDSAGIFAMG